MDNFEKRDRYAMLMTKLDASILNEFYYEAIFIEYAILEDRTESILKHAGISYRDSRGYGFKLVEKLKMIKSRREFQNDYIKTNISRDLIEDVITWKRQRDKLIHDLINSKYDNAGIKEIAIRGQKIIKTFSSKSTMVTKFLDKIEK